jgi:hypothetical protein
MTPESNCLEIVFEAFGQRHTKYVPLKGRPSTSLVAQAEPYLKGICETSVILQCNERNLSPDKISANALYPQDLA